MRTKTTKRVMISELGPVFHRHCRAIATGSELAGWFRSSGVVPSTVSASTSAGVVLGSDHHEINGQDHGKHNRHNSSSSQKPEYGPPEQGSAASGRLNFDRILFKALFGFRDQRSSGRSERVSWRFGERREICQCSWRLERSIVLARCVAQNPVRSWRSRRNAALGGGGGPGGEGGGEGKNRRRGSPSLLYACHTTFVHGGRNHPGYISPMRGDRRWAKSL